MPDSKLRVAGGGPGGGGGEAEVEYEDGVTWVIDDKAAASQADRAARPKGEVTAEMQAAAKRQKGIKAGWLADPTCAEVRSLGLPSSALYLCTFVLIINSPHHLP